MLIDADKVRDRYKAEAARELDETKTILMRAGAASVVLKTDHDFVPPLMAMFKRRKRQWN